MLRLVIPSSALYSSLGGSIIDLLVFITIKMELTSRGVVCEFHDGEFIDDKGKAVKYRYAVVRTEKGLMKVSVEKDLDEDTVKLDVPCEITMGIQTRSDFKPYVKLLKVKVI